MKNLKYLHHLLIVAGFGTAAILWGLQDLRAGRALMIYDYAYRAERPFAFWAIILVLRFAMGAVLLAALAWRLMNMPAA